MAAHLYNGDTDYTDQGYDHIRFRLHFLKIPVFIKELCSHLNISIIMGATGGHTRIYPAAVSHADQMRESRNTLNVAPGP